jgi:prepilin signal peptidase PulO-like enzyme (type II secretory pathway)
MNLLVAILVFILGAAIGSFMSVIIHRVQHKKKGILFSRSICPACKKKLKWHHLVPVFSWLFLRGKCGYCREKISGHYLALELFSGLLFLIVFLKWNFLQVTPLSHDPSLLSYSINWQIFEIFLFYIIEFSLFVGIFFYDLLYKIIPDRFSLPAIGVAIAGGLVFGTPEPMSMLIGAAAIFLFFFLQFLISKGAWIGGGDFRLAVLMGVLLGWEKAILALVLAYFIGSIIGIYLLISKKAKGKTQIPFGPFLLLGTIIAIFYGNQIIFLYLSTLTP